MRWQRINIFALRDFIRYSRIELPAFLRRSRAVIAICRCDSEYGTCYRYEQSGDFFRQEGRISLWLQAGKPVFSFSIKAMQIEYPESWPAARRFERGAV